jgi:ABC-type branched-subunit amino acid transport system substrate-binding protein
MPFRVVALLLLLLCCSPLALSAAAADAVPAVGDAALQRALDHYRAGKLNEAAGLLRGYIVSKPDSPLLDRVYYYLARIHRDLNDPATAVAYLDKVNPRAADPASILLYSELLLQLGDVVPAVDRLLRVDDSTWPLTQRQERFLSLAEGLLILDEPQRALYFYRRALLTEGDESPEDVLTRIYTLLGERLDDADLGEAAFMYREEPISYLAMLQLGWRALDAGRKDDAIEWANAALAAPAGFAYREEALTLQSQLSDPTRLQRAIGVLLPLSGRYAAFGERVKRGMELAMEEFRPRIPVRLIVRDTAGDQMTAARQAAELAVSDRVIGIAGPLVGNAALGAARRAALDRVPLLTLSQKEGLAALSHFVFRDALTPRLQVRALLDYAMGQAGLTTFGIMHPQNRQGETFAELFREEVERRGGEIVAVQSYDTEQTDFRFQVRMLRGVDPNMSDDEEERLKQERLQALGQDAVIAEEPPPFEALFLPDYADRVALIAPQLAFYGLEGLQLLGTNGWNDDKLPRLARQFVEEAVFTDGFFRYSTYPFVEEFAKRYFERFNEEPTILEAQGYDAVAILLSLLNDMRVRSREELQRALSQLQNFPGVTGATRFDSIGEADKVLFLLQVQNGTIVQIN